MRGNVIRRVRNVDDLGGGGAILAAEHAVTQTEIEGSADNDDQISFVECLAAGFGDQESMPAGHDAATHAVGHGGDVQFFDKSQCGDLRATGPNIGAEHHHRMLRISNQSSNCGDVILIGGNRGVLKTGDARQRCGIEELIHRDIDEGRAAMWTAGSLESFVQYRSNIGDPVCCGGEL